jgi:hypothetical protein
MGGSFPLATPGDNVPVKQALSISWLMVMGRGRPQQIGEARQSDAEAKYQSCEWHIIPKENGKWFRSAHG